MNLDLEKPNNGVGANPNFDTGADEQTSMIDQADYGATSNQSANPITSGQTSNLKWILKNLHNNGKWKQMSMEF